MTWQVSAQVREYLYLEVAADGIACRLLPSPFGASDRAVWRTRGSGPAAGEWKDDASWFCKSGVAPRGGRQITLSG